MSAEGNEAQTLKRSLEDSLARVHSLLEDQQKQREIIQVEEAAIQQPADESKKLDTLPGYGTTGVLVDPRCVTNMTWTDVFGEGCAYYEKSPHYCFSRDFEDADSACCVCKALNRETSSHPLKRDHEGRPYYSIFNDSYVLSAEAEWTSSRTVLPFIIGKGEVGQIV